MDIGEKSISYSGKEVQLLLKIVGVMKKIIVFNSEKIRQGWLNQSISKKREITHIISSILANSFFIVSVIQTLSTTQNHPKLRLEGFRLLILWISQIDLKDDTISSFKEKIDSLFATPIILDVFETFALPLTEEGSKDELLHELSQQASERWFGTGKGYLKVDSMEKRDSC